MSKENNNQLTSKLNFKIGLIVSMLAVLIVAVAWSGTATGGNSKKRSFQQKSKTFTLQQQANRINAAIGFRNNSISPLSRRINQRRLDRFDNYQQRLAQASPSIQKEAQNNQKYSRLGNQINSKKPNILYVLTDDQPIETMSVMRKTLDWFKDEGRIYKNAFVATPVCCPSRAEAMTGQYAHNNKVLNNNGALLFQEKIWIKDPEDKEKYLSVDKLPWTKTLQCDLYRNGYKNVLFGKYVNGWKSKDPYNSNGNIPTCFDRQESWLGFDKHHRAVSRSTLDTANKFPKSDDYLGDKAVEFISNQKNSDKPWFAYLSLHSPHLPFAPAKRYQDWQPPRALKHRITASERKYNLNGKPSYVKEAALNKYSSNPRRFNTAKYALEQQRMVKSVDDTMLRLRAALKKTNQKRNTVIIFTSDNGYLWGDHGLYNKFYPYLDSIEVPMMIIAPGKARRGSVDNRIVSNIDISSTIYHLTGIKPMFHQVDGYSMLGNHRREWFLSESGDSGVTPYWASAISKDYHYIETGIDKTVTGVEAAGPPKVPNSAADISFKEYYLLNNFKGSEKVNLAFPEYRAIPTQTIAEQLRKAAWQGSRANGSTGGCYGRIGSDSVNPCP
jgi:arylsulfatase A-like enzyme